MPFARLRVAEVAKIKDDFVLSAEICISQQVFDTLF